MSFRTLIATGLAVLSAAGAAAQTYTPGAQSFGGPVCVGVGCTASETYPYLSDLVVKEFDPIILFMDTSTLPGIPTRDWLLQANQANGLLEVFTVTDVETMNDILVIEGTAPAQALRIASSGYVGLGTSMPLDSLHVVDTLNPGIVLEQSGAGAFPPALWRITANHLSMRLVKPDNYVPVAVEATAPAPSVTVAGGGVGIRNGTPDATLHVGGQSGFATDTRVRIEEINTTTAPRALLELINNGRPEIMLANTATGGEWSFGAGTNFVLKQGTVGSDSSAKTKLFEITPTGNATLAGTLTTGGTTCGGGCDRVFSEGYALSSIGDHAAAMFALGHLPNVGPTPEGQPVDVTDKLGRVLNELEHAHIYIARQEDRIAGLEANLAALASRLRALETD